MRFSLLALVLALAGCNSSSPAGLPDAQATDGSLRDSAVVGDAAMTDAVVSDGAVSADAAAQDAANDAPSSDSVPADALRIDSQLPYDGFTGGFACGQSGLRCRDGEVCVANQGLTTSYRCASIPSQCTNKGNCACLGSIYCTGSFNVCSDALSAQFAIVCGCPTC
ncbi:MAG: hypothetical protein H6707_20785 [Deltaproteobacteria bacterium]|nr:hypothetical protein [Deltaproteobacteria bacterium]